MSENKKPWRWWVGTNNERYDASFATKEEALEVGHADYGGSFYICEAQGHEWPKLEAALVIERALDDAMDVGEMFGEVEPERIGGAEEIAASMAELQTLLDQWCEKWAHTFRQPDMFFACDNEEHIEADPLPTPTQGLQPEGGR